MKRKAVDEDDHYAGAGGKLTRKALRPRTTLTPYDRPAHTGRARGFGWISARSTPAVFSPNFSASTPIQDPRPSTSKALPQSKQEHYDRPSSSCNVYADPSNDRVFGEATNTCDNSGIAEVELWLKQRTFSREQSNYLKELLLSRTRDFYDHQGETEGILNQKVSIKSQSAVLPGHLLTPKPEESLKMEVVNGVSSSPVEIAKAYMEGLVTESFHEPRKAGLKNMSVDNNALASEMTYSSVIRSPVCWPGAIVESNGSHLTPKTSSSIFSKSKFQDGGEHQRTQTVSSSGWKKSSTALRGIKAIAMPTMSKDNNKALTFATPMTKDHQSLGTIEKNCDAAIKVAVSGSTPLNASSKTPSTPVLTSSPTDIAFEFPVSSSTSLNASPEPSTPSATSPVVSTMATSAANSMPSFIFHSPCPKSGLNFKLATISDPTVADTPEPQFKFRSGGDQRSLSFWFRNTESELC